MSTISPTGKTPSESICVEVPATVSFRDHLIRLSSNIQLWLIRHPNFITMSALSVFYIFELHIYTVYGPKKFLQERSKLLGKNFAGLGKIIVGDHRNVVAMIQTPQKRGHFFGRARADPAKLSKFFPVFLSDEGAGGTPMHSIIHEDFWTLASQALERSDGAEFTKYLEEGARAWKGDGNKRLKNRAIQTLTLKYIFHALLGSSLSGERQIETARKLFFGGSPASSFAGGAVKPFSTLYHYSQASRRSLSTAVKGLILETPLMKNYASLEKNGNMSKNDYAEHLLSLIGVAGMLGTSKLIKSVALIPEEMEINIGNRKEVTMAVLESARLRAPVYNVNCISQTEHTRVINQSEVTLPEGTVFAVSIGLASLDPVVFPLPDKFYHKRDNLARDFVNFNHIGFSPDGAGTRHCPGRNIAVKMASDWLVMLRT